MQISQLLLQAIEKLLNITPSVGVCLSMNKDTHNRGIVLNKVVS